jgi:hypothetical protein
LIAADLAAGVIDVPTALRYRAWALFWDPRLPERYDGAGSIGEDLTLLDDIAELAPSLPGDVRTELEAYLLRPTDPRSPLNIGPASTAAALTAAGGKATNGVMTAARAPQPRAPRAAAPAPTPAPTQCGEILALDWYALDWSPPGSSDPNVGFRVWKCAFSQADARADQDKVIAVAEKLWGPMTAPVPNGMGLPYPDTDGPVSDGNGRIDVYLVDPAAECRPRGADCETITGNGVALAARDLPSICGKHGFPLQACTGYLVIARSLLGQPDFADTFAHEFFHRLQQSHNGVIPAAWYGEASASWAGWHFVGQSSSFTAAEREASRAKQYSRAEAFQAAGRSLLYWTGAQTTSGWRPQYMAWTWPLFQSVQDGPGNVFLAWRALEGATTEAEYDAAIDRQLPFIDRFRDFAVWNAQPVGYVLTSSTGLDDVRWQKKPRLADYPTAVHHADGGLTRVELTSAFEPVTVDALDAWYQRFTVDPDVREIEIDIGGISNVANADLDVLVQLNNRGGSTQDRWRRIRTADTNVVLCRDQPDADARSIVVVISNHSRQRVDDEPDPAARLKDAYQITGRPKCRVPDHYFGTINGSNSRGDSWHGTATFDLVTTPDPRGGCRVGTYCYQLAGGQVSWTCARGGGASVSLVPPDNTGGLNLILSDAEFPNKDRSYGGIIVASDQETCGGRSAKLSVVAWLTIPGDPNAKIGADWRLTASHSVSGCGIEGDCGTQSWDWDFEPIFDP